MPIDTEDELLAFACDRTAAVDVFLQHGQRFAIDRERPLPAMLEFFGHGIAHFDPAFGAEGVASAQTHPAIRTGQPEARLEALDADSASFKVDVFGGQTKSLGYTAAEVEECPDKEFVSQIGRRLFHHSHFLWLNIRLHYFLTRSRCWSLCYPSP